MGHTDQLPIGKHSAGALTAVVQDHIYTQLKQLGIQCLGSSFDIGKPVWTDWAQHHGKRCQGIGPDDAAGIMILFNGSSRQPRDADAVAAHFHPLGLAIDIQKGGIHGLAVLGAQVKHMPHLNAPLNRQGAATIRRQVACHHIAQVGHAIGLGQIASPVHSGHVEIKFVGATNPVAHHRHLAISHHAQGFLQIDQAQVARFASKVRVDLRQRGKTETALQAWYFAGF